MAGWVGKGVIGVYVLPVVPFLVHISAMVPMTVTSTNSADNKYHNKAEDTSTDVPTKKERVLNDPDDPVTLFDTSDIYNTRPEDIGPSGQSKKLRGTP